MSLVHTYSCCTGKRGPWSWRRPALATESSQRLLYKIKGDVLHSSVDGMKAIAELIREHLQNLPNATLRHALYSDTL